MDILGELEIELGGKKYTLKPTFGGAAMIEEKSGKTITEIFNLWKKGNFGVKDIASIIYGGMYGKNNDMELMPFDTVGTLVMKDGYMKFATLWRFIAAIYSGTPISQFIAMVEERKEPAPVEPPGAEKKS